MMVVECKKGEVTLKNSSQVYNHASSKNWTKYNFSTVYEGIQTCIKETSTS